MQRGTKLQGKGGRPREYDPDAVLAAAVGTFLARGYSAPTVTELARATGLNRPSLSAGFGDKRSLYLAALRKYREEAEARAREALAHPDLSSALQAFFGAAVDLYAGGSSGTNGCLLLCTSPAEAASDRGIAAVLASTLKSMDEALVARLNQAKREGADLDAEALGPVLAAILHSIALRSRAGETAASLSAFASRAVAAILPGGS